ncbi:hypothetical protein EVJ58_g5853 [Rhodofomes roseus]|uniref:Uncharacterized protein n=1 Tax=Rhodofomes roseus TaxID=34475 RepID=A0A4Y9Y9R0_9APHY|nr:hypothetical protein EVJ58_g5853 [Rhodofomes roseus]
MDQSTMPSDGGKNHPRHEKVWNRVTVCYVEISDAFPAMRDRTPDVEQYVATYEGLDFVSLRLQDAFDPNWWNAVHASSDDQRFAADMTSEAPAIKARLHFNLYAATVPPFLPRILTDCHRCTHRHRDAGPGTATTYCAAERLVSSRSWDVPYESGRLPHIWSIAR